MCNGCGSIAHGAISIAKSMVGLDRAPEDVIESRRKTCRDCPEAEPCLVTLGKKCKCKLCGCLLTAKTSLASEVCPLGKW
jgi:hypothetical protein